VKRNATDSAIYRISETYTCADSTDRPCVTTTSACTAYHQCMKILHKTSFPVLYHHHHHTASTSAPSSSHLPHKYNYSTSKYTIIHPIYRRPKHSVLLFCHARLSNTDERITISSTSSRESLTQKVFTHTISPF